MAIQPERGYHSEMRMTRVRTATVVALIFLSSYGYAGQTETAAREQVKQATTAYNLGHFDEAAQHYEEAYRLVQDPVLLFDIGQSYRLGEKPEKALTAYHSYLRTAGPDAPNRAVVEKHVAELKRQLDESKSAASEPAPAASANTAATIAPTAAALTAAAPPPAASVLPPALTTSTTPADASTAATNTPSAESSSTPFYKRWWFWTGVGAAVVAGTVTAFAVSRSEQNACSGNALTCVGIK
jgi:tetratricopeptide (TPR) repeat protein